MLGYQVEAKSTAAIFLAALALAACSIVSLPGSDQLTATAKAESQPTELSKADSTSVEQTLEAKANPTQKPDPTKPAPFAFTF